MSRWIIIGLGLVLPLVIGPTASLLGQTVDEAYDESAFIDEMRGDWDGGCSEGCSEGCGDCTTCGSGSCHSGACASRCGSCCKSALWRLGCCGGSHSAFSKWAGSACGMHPHYAYFPSMHGYYYFRPYHHSHVRLHQQTVAGWGGDVRNPYSNEIFQAVYAERPAGQSGLVVPMAPLPQP